MDAAVGTLISYATKDGAVAADGEGDHSPYTQALLSYLERPGLEIGLLVRRVREEVMKATAGSQVPWDYGSLVGEFYFLPPVLTAGNPPSLPSAPVTSVDAMAVELSFWDSIKSTSNPALLREYLSQYPQGKFAKIAKLRVADLEAERRKQDEAASQGNQASPAQAGTGRTPPAGAAELEREKIAREAAEREAALLREQAARHQAEEDARKAKEAAERIAREAAEHEAALLREQAARQAAEEEARRAREAAERQLALQRPNNWATGQAVPQAAPMYRRLCT
jgi:uncharacterized caspase-like protein